MKYPEVSYTQDLSLNGFNHDLDTPKDGSLEGRKFWLSLSL